MLSLPLETSFLKRKQTEGNEGPFQDKKHQKREYRNEDSALNVGLSIEESAFNNNIEGLSELSACLGDLLESQKEIQKSQNELDEAQARLSKARAAVDAQVMECYSKIKAFEERYRKNIEIARNQERVKYFNSVSGDIEAFDQDRPVSNSVEVGIETSDQETKHRCFMRKPRCLVKVFETGSFITSSLDGRIQFWSESEKRVISSKSISDSSWIEDMRVFPIGSQKYGAISCLNLRVAGDLAQDQIMVMKPICFGQDPSSCSVVMRKSKPHKKEISCVEHLAYAEENDCHSFVTGSLDKSIALWKCEGGQESVSSLTSKHTSAIQSLRILDGGKLFSGGADCRLFSLDLCKNQTVLDVKLKGRISNVMKWPSDPNLALVTLCTKMDQLHLIDQRTGRSEKSFGWEEPDNVSRYSSPSIHHNGCIVAMGTSSLAPAVVNFWDIRQITDGTALHSHKVSEGQRKILKTEFFSNQLVAMGSDASMSFIDFKIKI